MAEAQVQRLFSELQSQLRKDREDYKKALATSNKILALKADDQDAIKCKCMCMLHLDDVKGALELCTSDAGAAGDLLAFERVYCLYRLNRVTEARDALAASDKAKSVGYRHITAQVHYRLNEYSESIRLYEEMIAADPDASPELRANMAAAFVRTQSHDALRRPELNPADFPDSYELAYNLACSLVSEGKSLEAARTRLESARDTCIRVLQEEDFNPGEIANEVAIINVQLGFVLQRLRHFDAAADMYRKVLKQRPDDASVAAVASNNLISLRGDAELFDSFKRIRQATASALQHKLSPTQQETFLVNKAVLLLFMKRLDECRDAVAALQEAYPHSPKPWLIQAALLVDSGDTTGAEAVLRDFAAAHAEQESATDARLALAQLYSDTGRFAEAAAEILALAAVRDRPAALATAASLLERAGDVDGAVAALADAAAHWRGKASGAGGAAGAAVGAGAGGGDAAVDAAAVARRLTKAAADIKVKYGRHKEADAEYSALLEDPSIDKATRLAIDTARVVAASHFDVAAAEALAGALPELVRVPVEALEAAAVTTALRPRRASSSAAAAGPAYGGGARRSSASASVSAAGKAAGASGGTATGAGAGGGADGSSSLDGAGAMAAAGAAGHEAGAVGASAEGAAGAAGGGRRSNAKAAKAPLTPEQAAARAAREKARRDKRKAKRRTRHIRKLVAEGRVDSEESALLYKPSADRWARKQQQTSSRATRKVINVSGGAQGSGDGNARDTERLDVAARKKREEDRKAKAAADAAEEAKAAEAKPHVGKRQKKKKKKGRR